MDPDRNFPDNWQPGDPGSLFYAGPRPASEPETRAFIAGAEQIQPDAVVSYHQRANVIDRGSRKKTRKWVKRLSRDLRLPISRVSCVTKCVGTMSGWFNTQFRGWAVTVELPARISVPRQKSMARAMIRLARTSNPPPSASRLPSNGGREGASGPDSAAIWLNFVPFAHFRPPKSAILRVPRPSFDGGTQRTPR